MDSSSDVAIPIDLQPSPFVLGHLVGRASRGQQDLPVLADMAVAIKEK